VSPAAGYESDSSAARLVRRRAAGWAEMSGVSRTTAFCIGGPVGAVTGARQRGVRALGELRASDVRAAVSEAPTPIGSVDARPRRCP
jgi:hypothetical protein